MSAITSRDKNVNIHPSKFVAALEVKGSWLRRHCVQLVTIYQE